MQTVNAIYPAFFPTVAAMPAEAAKALNTRAKTLSPPCAENKAIGERCFASESPFLRGLQQADGRRLLCPFTNRSDSSLHYYYTNTECSRFRVQGSRNPEH